MSYNIIGEQISKFRRAKGLTQRELGEAIGVSSSAVSQWESGGTPDISLLPALSDVLGVTVDSLFGREEARREDMAESVGKYLSFLPKEKRLAELITLARRAMIIGCVDQINDIVDFEKRDSEANYIDNSGIASAVCSGGAYYIFAAQSDESGLGGLIKCDERVSRLFAVLSGDGALNMLSSLYGEAPKYRTAGALAKLTGMPVDAAESILKQFTELNLAEQLQLETEDGAINAYSVNPANPSCAAMPLLISAKLVAEHKSFMKIISDSRTAKPSDNSAEKGEQPC